MCHVDVAHTNILMDCWARGADGLVILINGIATARYAAFKQLDADEFPFEALLFDLEQGSASDEISLIEFDGPAQPGFERVDLLGKLMVVKTHAGLQSQGIARAQARGQQPVWFASRQQVVPETDGILGSAI